MTLDILCLLICVVYLPLILKGYNRAINNILFYFFELMCCRNIVTKPNKSNFQRHTVLQIKLSQKQSFYMN